MPPTLADDLHNRASVCGFRKPSRVVVIRCQAS